MSHKIRTRVYQLAVLLLVSLAISGCAGGTSGKEYRRSQPVILEEVEMGRVESVRDVLVTDSRTYRGRGPSVIVGGGIGSGGRSSVGVSIGTVLGGWGGEAPGESVTYKAGYEITVRLDSGRLIAVTQTADENFRTGDRVRVLTGNGVTRVSH